MNYAAHDTKPIDIVDDNSLRPKYTPEQEAIDREVFHLEDRLIQLKRRRNTFSPVSRIPPEILLQIFHLVRSPSHIPIGETLPWIRRLTHICFAWRALALGDVSLWTTLCFDTPEMLSELIKRSGEEKTLTLMYNYNDICLKRADRDMVLYKTTLPSALRQIHRLQHLELVFTGLEQTLPKEALKLVTEIDAPLLRTFILTGSSDDDHDYDLKLSLPPSLFLGWTCLKTLELRDCKFSWSSLVQFGLVNPNLQRLVISHCSTRHDANTEDVFQNMTQLRYLELNCGYAFEDLSPPGYTRGSTFSFSYLQTLIISGYSLRGWLHFLKHIDNINPSVRLTFNVRHEGENLLSGFAPFLSRIWAPLSPPLADESYKPLLGIVLNHGPSNNKVWFRLELHHTLSDIQNNSSSDSPCTINVDIRAIWHAEKAVYAWRILEDMDLTTVEHLHIHTPMEKDLWIQASKKMPKLETVRYIVDDLQSFVQALQAEWIPGQDATTPVATARYPTILTQVKNFDLGIKANELEPAQFDGLVRYFEVRNQMGMRCEKFMIGPELSGYSRQLRSRLAQYVDIVHGYKLN